MPGGWGTIGTPNWPGQAIPQDIANQYPGTGMMRRALGGFSRLAFGPEASGLADVGAAQASDPEAEAYQEGVSKSGGAYGPGNSATLLYSGLLNNMFKNAAMRQQIQSQSVDKALSGIADTGENLANAIYGQQKADTGLEEAQNQASGEELGGFSQILNMLTNPKGMGANIMGLATGSNTASPLGDVASAVPGMYSKIANWLSPGALVPELGVPGGADIFGGAGLADVAFAA